MIQPPRPIFWRFVLLTTCLFALLTGWNLINLAGRLNVQILARPAWLGALVALGSFAGVILLGYWASFSKTQEKLYGFLEWPSNIFLRQIGIGVLLIASIGFSITTSLAGFQKILGHESWVRVLIFWLFSLLGMWGFKIFRKETEWLASLITVILSQAALHLLLSYWSQVTSYPFAMGWSETSRYYFPSLFLSQTVYGQKFPLPILHPTLHLLLVPPYLFGAPLWFHRFWQVALRYILIAAIVPAMLKRVSIPEKGVRWLVALWIFLFLFMGPIYFHLTIPVILILTGFSLQDDRRNWFVILLASAWCGWSRVNWYPMPALMAVVLYVLETPFKGRNLWHYLWRPALWGVIGTSTAFAFQRLYIAISGVSNSKYFYTSVTSDLLWYRLFPNATYPPGILLAVILASLTLWIILGLVVRAHKDAFHPLRIALMIAALAAVFTGGVLVSLKIGGGADLHNMDAYFILLLIIFSYLVFAKYSREDGSTVQPVQLPWTLVVALIIVPVWSAIQPNIGFVTYDEERTKAVLANLQEHIDQINAQGGEVLFITQRQLISMGMLHGVTLVPEYEREDLMEMAMGDNIEYLGKFRSDIENQRFDLIVVDPLRFFKMTSRRSFAEENNAWVTEAAKFILCNYREEAVFPVDNIALYVPQVGERQCP